MSPLTITSYFHTFDNFTASSDENSVYYFVQWKKKSRNFQFKWCTLNKVYLNILQVWLNYVRLFVKIEINEKRKTDKATNYLTIEYVQRKVWRQGKNNSNLLHFLDPANRRSSRRIKMEVESTYIEMNS